MSGKVHQENPDGWWFPAKRYGWGWGIPSTWQGWVVLVAHVALVAGATAVVTTRPVLCSMIVLGSTIGLIVICYRKGEPPKWRWGGDDGCGGDE